MSGVNRRLYDALSDVPEARASSTPPIARPPVAGPSNNMPPQGANGSAISGTPSENEGVSGYRRSYFTTVYRPGRPEREPAPFEAQRSRVPDTPSDEPEPDAVPVVLTMSSQPRSQPLQQLVTAGSSTSSTHQVNQHHQNHLLRAPSPTTAVRLSNSTARNQLAGAPGASNQRQARPSSRRALVQALELAQEAVRLDHDGENPFAAIDAYARSVALLSDVMFRVSNAEMPSNQVGDRQSQHLTPREEEVQRLRSIHNTYADRLEILCNIHNIPMPDIRGSNNRPPAPPPAQPPAVPASVLVPAQLPAQRERQEIAPVPQSNTPIDPRIRSPLSVESIRNRSGVRESIPVETNRMSQTAAAQHRAAVRTSQSQYNAADPSFAPGAMGRGMANHPAQQAAAHQRSSTDVPLNVNRMSQQVSARRPSPSTDGFPPSINNANTSRTPTRAYTDLPSPVSDSNTPRHSVLSAARPNLDQQQSHPSQRTITAPQNVGSPSYETAPSATGSISSRSRNNTMSSQGSWSDYGVEQMAHDHNASKMQSLVSGSIAQGSIAQRRNVYPALPTSNGAGPAPRPQNMPPLNPVPGASRLGIETPPPLSAGVAPGRSRAISQPGRRPSIPSAAQPSPEYAAYGNRIPNSTNSPAIPPVPVLNSVTVSHMSARRPSVPSARSVSGPQIILQTPGLSNGHLHPLQTSSLQGSHMSGPRSPPVDPLRRPFHLMTLLLSSLMSKQGGYLTRKLYVPHDVWSQGGAKLTNLSEKSKCLEILNAALDDVSVGSSDFFRGAGRNNAERWLKSLDDWTTVCDSVTSGLGKKLGVGEGFSTRKSNTVSLWSGKLKGTLDRMTNTKNFDSPLVYTVGLSRLFQNAQLFDDHVKAFSNSFNATPYSTLSPEIRHQVEARLKRSAEFFASVVLTWVIRDLGLLLDKYVRKGEKWLAE